MSLVRTHHWNFALFMIQKFSGTRNVLCVQAPPQNFVQEKTSSPRFLIDKNVGLSRLNFNTSSYNLVLLAITKQTKAKERFRREES